VGHRLSVNGDGELGLRSGQLLGEAAGTKLLQSCTDCLIDGIGIHLHLVQDAVCIGEGDDAAAWMHARQYRRIESEV